ncbi:ABC transporter substrate-binding protein [Bradyrhizobium diazoefficiens USDA 110]|uniref:ABC transporter substrate-binding protein n=3 Tax=Bradyrhizobium diazoefficiens TaxID=1355477 RepID=Q89PD5_BRADU|nr:ABC transporter substrate-binding protein [Bradyrhizobium diazoefficiens]QBP22325.1 extracellular solute-binding protein [Bradyrhizobium diazoefficiens]QHP71422.1 extracellular solute-binding protein [Bradyrhizobium sp. LCT2]BAC48812.1 ABC transporter substrate-binding protein [Bradyrhizobium diazoefficiens USDA 110]
MHSGPAARLSQAPDESSKRRTSMSKKTWKRTSALLALASALSVTLPAAAQKLEDQLVIATTGGLMGNTLAKYFYEPFNKARNVEVVPVAVEVPDQWARAKAMQRTGKMEFDIVTATGPDLVGRTDMLEKIDCAKLPSVQKFGVSDACQPYGVARTTGGMLITYNTEAFKEKAPKTWADFWDVKQFPGPRGLPDTGDSDWWVPVAALLADGVKADQLFPLDLNRAYKKLDEIRPNVSVWWKTGDQVQQIMRSREVVLAMSYSGRALAVVKEGAPVAMSWDQAIRDTGYMAVLKGAPDLNAAMAYLDFFYASPDAHVPFMRAVNYATASKSAIELLKPEERNLYATSPENYEKLVKPDFAWIGEHRNELRERWMAWLTR